MNSKDTNNKEGEMEIELEESIGPSTGNVMSDAEKNCKTKIQNGICM